MTDGANHGERVTALRALRRDPTRIAVEVAGRRAAVIDSNSATEIGIEPGAAWTPALAAAVERAQADLQARRSAVQILTRAPRTRATLIAILTRRGHSPEAAEHAARSLERAGLIDDRALAEGYVRSRLERRRSSPAQIEAKLGAHGIDPELARSIVREAMQGHDEISIALDMLRERIARARARDPRTMARRLIEFLLRRGFEPEFAEQAARRAMAEAGIEFLEG